MNTLKASPMITALRDISKYLDERGLLPKPFSKETWIVSSDRINNKQQRKLNKELGIHVVNRNKFNMSRTKSK